MVGLEGVVVVVVVGGGLKQRIMGRGMEVYTNFHCRKTA